MIAPCEAAGILLVREGLILSSVRAEWITFLSTTSPSLSKAAASPHVWGSAASLSTGEARRLWTPPPRSARGTPPPGGRHPCDQTPNPRALCPQVPLYSSITNLATSLARNMDRLSLDAGALQPAGGVAAAAPGEPGRGLGRAHPGWASVCSPVRPGGGGGAGVLASGSTGRRVLPRPGPGWGGWLFRASCRGS